MNKTQVKTYGPAKGKTPMPRSLTAEIQGVRFSAPRKLACFHDWPTPNGPAQRDLAILSDDKRRERGITWMANKPRLTAGWHDRVRIVDGDNGRTYVICYSGDFKGSEGRAVIYRGNLKPECVVLVNAESSLWFAIRELCYV